MYAIVTNNTPILVDYQIKNFISHLCKTCWKYKQLSRIAVLHVVIQADPIE